MTVKSNAPGATIEKICDSFKEITSKHVNFLTVQDNFTEPTTTIIKQTYDLAKTFDESFHKNVSKKNPALKKLIINNLDEEQIWQQLEIQNNYKNSEFLRLTSEILSANSKLKSITFPFKYQDEEEEVVEEEEENLEDENEEENDDEVIKKDNFDDLNEEDEEDVEDDEVNEPKSIAKPTKAPKNSIVDDKFFKLDELEQFLDYEDKKELKHNDSQNEEDEEDELIDYFEDIDDTSEEEEKNDESLEEAKDENQGMKFNDFFRSPEEQLVMKKKKATKDKKLRFADDDEEEDDDEEGEDGDDEHENFDDEGNEDDVDNSDDEYEDLEEGKKSKQTNIKSSLELRQERLKSKIESLEDDMLSEKPWQMKGEVRASKRPQNSLLEEVVEFDLTSRPAPIITEKTSLKLEDMIKQRIKDKVYDDVERKLKPVDTPQEFRKKLALDQEKSKLSLAQIYEQEFLKQAETTTANPLDEKPEEVPKEHEEIKKMMDHLFKQLDALSNFHYTPKMVLPEIRIVSNTPAIEMEEVAPVTTTDATLLAPEEVKRKKKGELMSKEERTDTDKKRERRKKKIFQKEKQKSKDEREKMRDLMNPGIGKKFSKEKMKKTLENVTKSRNVSKMVDSDNTKSVKSSTAFFNQLQDQVKATIKRKTGGGNDKKKSESNAKKLKL